MERFQFSLLLTGILFSSLVSTALSQLIDFNAYVNSTNHDLANNFQLYGGAQTTNQYVTVTNHGITGGAVAIGTEANNYVGNGMLHKQHYTNQVGSTIYLSCFFHYKETSKNPFVNSTPIGIMFIRTNDVRNVYGVHVSHISYSDSFYAYLWKESSSYGSALLSLSDGNWYRCMVTLESVGGAFDENKLSGCIHDYGPLGNSPPTLIYSNNTTISFPTSFVQGIFNATKVGGIENIDNYEITYTPPDAPSPTTNGPIVKIYQAVELTWDTETNNTYQVQWASSLNSNIWHNLGSPVEGTESEASQMDRTRDQNTKFYKVLMMQQ